MKDAVKLGWWVPESIWDRFVEYVEAENGASGGNLQYHVCVAMTQFLDQDQELAEAEGLLRDLLEVRGLSSSTATFATDRYNDLETTKVQLRVKRDLKEEFQIFVDEHDGPSYGRALAQALDSYTDGGRASRVKRLVESLVTGVEDGSNGGTIEDIVESDLSTEAFNGSTGGTTTGPVESSLSTDGGDGSTTGTSVDVKAEHVLDIVDELPDDLSSNVIPDDLVCRLIVQTVGNGGEDVIDAYRDAVLEQVNAEEHPHKNGVYITESFREDAQLYADMDRDECEIALRRFVATDAARRDTLKRAYSYKEVQELFEDFASGAPSHQYAYTLMESCDGVNGFEYKEIRGNKRLRVDLSEVSASIKNYVKEQGFEDSLHSLGVNGRIEDYDPNCQPGGTGEESAADD